MTDNAPLTRRRFLQTSALSAATAAAGGRLAAAGPSRRPNFLFVISDQLGLDAISAHGCAEVHTPNLDRLIQRGTSFRLSYSTNPVCSPARSSFFTGRMPVETGVISNSRPLHDSVPSMGHWFRQAGYETVYVGKWHLPGGEPRPSDGFTVLPARTGQGDLGDPVVSRTCEAYLKNRDRSRPFVLVSSLLQPHDICYWAIRGSQLVPEALPFPQLADQLPELPPNHKSFPPAPAKLAAAKYTGFTEAQWRYYLWIYYRQVEMVDADIGRVLEALEDAGEADNTIIVFTADHGEGRGRHSHVQKWYPYEEAALVPLVVSCPGRLLENHRDATHLVSGLDILPTLCDYAGIAPPPDCRGRSLRPLLEGRTVQWREFVAFETQWIGRSIRTADFKYVHYRDDPIEQLFDMQNDPWETKNLYQDPAYADLLRAHAKLLTEWEAHLTPVPPTPDYAKLARKGRKS